MNKDCFYLAGLALLFFGLVALIFASFEKGSRGDSGSMILFGLGSACCAASFVWKEKQ